MTPSELRSPVVLDATVLSNFAYTDDLSLFEVLPAQFVSVSTVIDELNAGIEDGYEFLERARSLTKIELALRISSISHPRSTIPRGEKLQGHHIMSCHPEQISTC